MVLPKTNRNHGNYRYGNYVGSAPSRLGNYPKGLKTENTLLGSARGSVNIVRWLITTGYVLLLAQ